MKRFYYWITGVPTVKSVRVENTVGDKGQAFTLHYA